MVFQDTETHAGNEAAGEDLDTSIRDTVLSNQGPQLTEEDHERIRKYPYSPRKPPRPGADPIF